MSIVTCHMFNFFDHYKKTGYLHHAHFIEGVQSEVVPLLLSAIERHMGLNIQGNPDLSVEAYESFGIDESRRLTEVQSRAGFEGNDAVARKIFIIGAKSFTHEAQNALLKTFEDPTVGTHFFFIIPRADTILATLKSRVVLIDGRPTSINKDEAKELAKRFLDGSLAEQFALIKKLTETKKGEPVNREMIRRILDHLERILYTRLAGKKEGSDIFHEIYQTKTYLSDRGSSPRMLLENFAITYTVSLTSRPVVH